MEIRAAKLASGVLHGSQQGKREEMGPEARLSCVYILRGSESGRVPILPFLPPLTPSFPPSFAVLAGTAPCVSGQISPTVGSAGLCGGLFILERGLPSGSLHLSKHPPGRCSLFPASHSSPPTTTTTQTTPPPSPTPSPPGSLCSFSHPPSALSLLHCGSPLVTVHLSHFSLTLSFPSSFLLHCLASSPSLHLSCLVLSSIAACSHDSVSLALSPLSFSCCLRAQIQDRLGKKGIFQCTLPVLLKTSCYVFTHFSLVASLFIIFISSKCYFYS